MSEISHSGVIERIDHHKIYIRIAQTSACAACRVSAHCAVSETKEKIITVNDEHAAQRQVGDNVVVTMPTRSGAKAVGIAFILPFLLVVAVLMLTLWATGDEATAALAALGSLLPYYLALRLFDKYVSRQFEFKIKQ